MRCAIALLALVLAVTPAVAEIPPIAENVLVPNQLSVRIYAIDLQSGLGPVPVWIYVSRGLARNKQKEIVTGVKREPSDKPEAYPVDVLSLYQTIDTAAVKVGTVDAGDRTQFSSQVAMLGNSDLRCVLYLPVPPLPEIELPEDSILGLIVPCKEVDAAFRYGTLRLMMRLGLAAKFQPTPVWVDRRRTQLQTDNTGSILEKMPTFSGWNATARRDGQKEIVLRVPTVTDEKRRAVKDAFDKIGKDFVVGFLMSYDLDADSCMRWSPSQPKGELNAQSLVNPDAHRRTMLNFVTFIPGQKEDKYSYVEDGVAVFLTDATWQKVKLAIASRKLLDVPFRDETTLDIIRAEDPFTLDLNPPSTMGPIQLSRVSFFTSQRIIERHVEISQMMTFLDGIMDAARESVIAHPLKKPVDLHVDIEADAKGRISLRRSYRPLPPHPFEAAFDSRLGQIPTPQGHGAFKIGLDIHLAFTN